MENTNKSIVVVGDHIKAQLSDNIVLGADDFLAQLADGQISKGVVLNIGQGLSATQLNAVKAVMANQDANNRHAKKATRHMTHKSLDGNIMISEPEAKALNHYECQLMLDDNCAEMSDHLTGQHIQAMVLLESARQFNTAVCEKYLINKSSSSATGLVLDSLAANFMRYIYPFDVKLVYTLDKIRKSPAGFFTARAIISFIQNDNICAEAKLCFSGLDKSFLMEREKAGIETLFKTLTVA